MSRAVAVRRWLTVQPLRADVLLAAAVLGMTAAALSTDPGGFGAPVLAVAAWGAAAVALRRRRPAWAVGAVALAHLAATGLAMPEATVRVALFVVLYTAAAVLPLAQAVGAAAVLAAPVAVHLGLRVSDSDRWLGLGLTLLVCFLVGRTVRTQRAYTRALEERASTAEAGREASAREAVLEERRRIARELHDVVAHHVSVMGVMASGARRSLTRDPEAAGEALSTIEATGRTTLRELRRLLDVLRRDDESDAALEPQPGIGGLEALVAQVREAGLPVDLVVTGRPEALDPGIDLTVFRIVQEGLTNTLKHAGPAKATVRVAFHPDRVDLRVDDDGTGAPVAVARTGHGLVGMRERVSLYGGSLSAGRGAGVGYSLVVTIPIDAVREVRR